MNYLINYCTESPQITIQMIKRQELKHSSRREVRRLLMTKPAILKILSTAAVVGAAQETIAYIVRVVRLGIP